MTDMMAANQNEDNDSYTWWQNNDTAAAAAANEDNDSYTWWQNNDTAAAAAANEDNGSYTWWQNNDTAAAAAAESEDSHEIQSSHDGAGGASSHGGFVDLATPGDRSTAVPSATSSPGDTID